MSLRKLLNLFNRRVRIVSSGSFAKWGSKQIENSVKLSQVPVILKLENWIVNHSMSNIRQTRRHCWSAQAKLKLKLAFWPKKRALLSQS